LYQDLADDMKNNSAGITGSIVGESNAKDLVNHRLFVSTSANIQSFRGQDQGEQSATLLRIIPGCALLIK